LNDVVDRLRAAAAGNDAIPQTGELLCFLPAKPGVGASTIAINTASALAKNNGLRVLLVDTDLGSGMIKFMLQIKHERSFWDAMNRVGDMDPNLWMQLATNVGGGLDVLHAGAVSPDGALDSTVLLTLLGFWRRLYDVICLDLSGNLEPFSFDVMFEANKIFLVSTSELCALHLVREKAELLKRKGLGGHVHVIHNRKAPSDDLTTEGIEDVIELPIFKTFRNSYTETKAAIREGRAVRADSTLGLEFGAFAAQLRGANRNPKRNPLRDMLSGFKQKLSKPVAAV
jgi:pilus assembly protein CpaE